MFQKGEKRSITKILELFSQIPEPISASVLSMGRFRNFPSGEILFCLGDPAKEVFLLIEGRVKTTQLTKNGKEVILRLESPTDLFGSLGMDLQGRHNSTAQAIEESKALVWDTNMFKAALSRFPILERNTQGILERRICELEQRFCEVATEKASTRLARELLRLQKQIGRKRNGQREIKIRHEWVAEMAAMSEFTVSRFLAEWERQGVVSVRHGTIAIQDYKSLKSLCREPRTPSGLI
jgi:CRP/FNR family transcriptional regulator, nitrogen oxide reductase regulator